MDWSFDPKTPQWQELCDRINNNELADIVALVYISEMIITQKLENNTLVVSGMILSTG